MRACVCVCVLLFVGVPSGEAWARLTPETDVEAPSAAVVASAASSRADLGLKLPALQFAAGAGAALVTTPLSLWAATALGTLSSNLVLAALPSVVLFAALPPVAVTLAAALVGNHLSPGSSRIGPAMWVTVGAQVVILTASILFGASSRNFGDAALISLADVLLLPAVATGTMALTRPSAIPNLLPPEQRTLSLPVVSLAF